MKPILAVLLLGAAVILSASNGAADTTLVSANFDSDAAGTTYQSNGTLDGMSLTAGSTGYVTVANDGTGNNVLQFIDNTPTGTTGAPTLLSHFTGATTDGTGNNWIVGTFDFTLSSQAGYMCISIDTPNQTGTSGNTTLVQLAIDDNGANGTLIATIGNNGSRNLGNVTLNTTYTATITLDMSNYGAEQWAVQIAPASAPTNDVVDSGWMTSRASNIQAGTLIFNGAFNASAASTTPFISLDNINVTMSSVPEPGPLGLAGAGLLGLLAWGRRLRREASIAT